MLKRIFPVLLIFIFLGNHPILLKAQDSTSTLILPRFPGCEEGLESLTEKIECSNHNFLKYIHSNLVLPINFDHTKLEGRIMISLIINKKGEVTKEKIEQIPIGGEELGANALQVITSMRENKIRWIPGIANGKEVSVYYVAPFNFHTNGSYTKYSTEESSKIIIPNVLDNDEQILDNEILKKHTDAYLQNYYEQHVDIDSSARSRYNIGENEENRYITLKLLVNKEGYVYDVFDLGGYKKLPVPNKITFASFDPLPTLKLTPAKINNRKKKTVRCAYIFK
ncbi:MAG: energy transducer TonB, partial [Saprospiraceae bacterium]|nr:energy transducer TonB [Saprospiraceae bacterium]